MISEWAVLGWLNYDSFSQLDVAIINQIRQIRSRRLSEDEADRLLNSLISRAPTLKNLHDQAELQVNCAILSIEHTRIQDAVKLLLSVEQIYRHSTDLHRSAVADWLLFCLYERKSDHEKSLYWAGQAKSHLSQLQSLWFQKADAARTRWYNERILDLSQDLITIPHYVYSCFHLFNGRLLSPSALNLMEKVNNLAKHRMYDDACRCMDQLKIITRDSRDPTEIAEVNAYCALLQYEMGNKHDAVHLLKYAKAQFPPADHKYALVQWMLGMIQSEIADQRSAAVRIMEESVENIRRLAEIADHKNLPEQRSWYKLTAEVMGRALKKTVAATA